MNKEIEHLIRVTRRLLNNIYEFGAPTDGIFIEQVEEALNKLEITPPMRYWQHDETGRLCAIKIRPGDRWYEITKEQYEQATTSMRVYPGLEKY